ncbi:MAG: hypothetical protein OEY14_14170 [Myxococcales bacterium]|nr:hypothetical protein [Myxococcales bacterium]
MTIEADTDIRSYFRARLAVARGRLGLEVPTEVEFYLVDLLARQAEAPADALLGVALVERLGAALEVEEPAERLRRFRDTGDCALYVSGFFRLHFESRGISRSYVRQMGGRAYRGAADAARIRCSPHAEVFPELAEGFEGYSGLLDEIREETALRTPQDIVRLYDQYRRTRSPSLAARLHAAGVFPQLPGSGRLH